MKMETRAVKYHIMAPFSKEGVPAAIIRSSLEEQIKYSLRAAILTHKGERELHKGIGSDVHEMLFRPLHSSLKPEIKSKIKTAVQQSEPRVQLLDIELNSDRSDKSKIMIYLKYQIRQT